MSGKPRPCGCKGYRSCLQCEELYQLPAESYFTIQSLRDNGIPVYVYCPECDKAWPGDDCDLIPQQHSHHEGEPIEFPGVIVKRDFLTDNECLQLLNSFDGMPWELSQSGRRKQNFGPKANFRKRKLQLGAFRGFPDFSQLFYDRMKTVPLLEGYRAVEQCSLEYEPSRGAAIEPHIDDCWVWGERIVTVNLLGKSVLTMTKYKGDDTKYNLDCVDIPLLERVPDVCVRIPMPCNSLIVLHGSARYQWEHCILRSDIVERRVCIALREFTRPYLEPGELVSQAVLEAASQFFPV